MGIDKGFYAEEADTKAPVDEPVKPIRKPNKAAAEFYSDVQTDVPRPSKGSANLIETNKQRVDNITRTSRNQRMKFEREEREFEADMGRQERALTADFEALRTGTPEQVQDWKTIAEMTVGLGFAEDEEAQELKNALLWNYGDQLKEHVNVIDKDWWEDNYTEPPEVEDDSLLGWKSKVGKLTPVFDYLDQWGQASLSAIGGLTAAIDQNDGVSAGDALKHVGKQVASFADPRRVIPGMDSIDTNIRTGDGRELSMDIDGDGGLNLREALGKDPEAGGRLLGAIDMIGTIALDPTTYATLGTGSLAKIGMQGVEEAAERAFRESAGTILSKVGDDVVDVAADRTLAASLNKRIRQSGFKSLEETEQRWYQAMLRTANEIGIEGGGQATNRLGRDLAEDQLKAIERGGRDGLRLGGTTVLPSRGVISETLGRGSDNFATRPVRQVDEVADVTDPALAKQVDEAITDLGIIDMPSMPPVNKLNDGAEVVEWFRQGASRGLLGQILDIPAVQKVTSALSPRARIRAIFGSDIADRLGGLLSTTSNSPKVKEIEVRLGLDGNRNGLMRKSLQEMNLDQDGLSRVLNDALSSREGRETALDSVGPETAKLINALHDVRVELYNEAKKAGMDADQLRNVDSYIPRILSNDARKDDALLDRISNVEGIQPLMSDDRVAEGFMQNRTIAENLDNLFDANSEASRILEQAGIGKIDEIFETNPLIAIMARTQSGFRASADIDLLNGITKLEGDGLQLGFRATADETAKLTADEVAQGMIRQAGGNIADFKRVRLANGDVYRIHNDVAKELEDVRRIFGDPKQLDAVGKFLDKTNNVWAMSATVMGVNPGFHVRNGIGNMFNAFLGGTRDIFVFAKAKEYTGDMAQITKKMRETGESWESVIKDIDVPDNTKKILTDARRLGVLNDGRSLDILREQAGQDAVSNKLTRTINPADPNSVLNKPGIFIGQSVENNARLGVYIDQINKGSTPEVAAAHVKKTLFDYGDLTRFESEKLRRVSRFYTFMRKNTALQAYTLAKYPGRVANAEEAVAGTLDAFFGSGEDTEGQAPPWMPGARVVNLPLGGGTAAISVDTPFKSFEETMQILTGPPSDNPLDRLGTDAWLSGFIERSNMLFSGVVPGTLDFLNERTSGRDAFTGRRLDPENQFRDTALFGAVATFLPAASRFEGIAARNEKINEAFGLRKDQDGNIIGAKSGMMQFLNAASGLQAYNVDEDTEGSARYVLQRELENFVKELEDAGVDVPSVAELREQGEIEMKNQVVETLMYGWKIDPDTKEMSWDDEETNGMLLQLLPKNVRDAFVDLGVLTEEQTARSADARRVTDRGARPDAEEGSEEYYAQESHKFNQALLAIETYLDRELTDDEKWTMVSAFGGALGTADQEAAGFNPYRQNRLLDDSTGNGQEELDDKRKEELFNQRLSAVGLDWETALERHPRISVMQRNMEDAREAGWSEEEIRTALYFAKDEGGMGWTSRKDRAAINQFITGDREGGAVPLTTTRNPITTDEDLQKLQTKVWNASEELKLIFQFEGWGTPTQEQLFMYGVNNLTKGEQRMLGIDPLESAPSRDDIRSDEQKEADARAKFGGVQAGLESPYRWER